MVLAAPPQPLESQVMGRHPAAAVARALRLVLVREVVQHTPRQEMVHLAAHRMFSSLLSMNFEWPFAFGTQSRLVVVAVLMMQESAQHLDHDHVLFHGPPDRLYHDLLDLFYARLWDRIARADLRMLQDLLA